MAHEDEDERDMREIAVYDDEALKMMQGWTGGQSDPLYAISSTGGWNYAWVFTDAIANLDRDISRVKKLGRNEYQLGGGTFTKEEIDELHYIRDALQMALDDPESELPEDDDLEEARGRHAGPGRVRAPRASAQGRWTVEAGRQLYFDGHPCISVGREGSTDPTVADGATHLIAELLNNAGTTPDTIYRRHMGHDRRRR